MPNNARLQFICLFIFSSAFSIRSVAQRGVPVGALPTYYNGGFAGEAGVPRLASFSYVKVGLREFSPDDSPYNNAGTFISFDHFLKKIGTGVAFTAGTEKFSRGSKGNFVSLSISPKMSSKGKITFAPFADISYQRFNNTFLYELTPPFPSRFVTEDLVIRSGFLLNSSRAYIGLSAEVLSYATDFPSLKENWKVFPDRAINLQAGYTFQQTPESKFSFTPQLALSFSRGNYYYYSVAQPIKKMNFINLMDLNLMFRYDKWLAGINSAGFVLGYQTNKFKLQVTNFYSNKPRDGKTWEIGDHTRFNTSSGFGSLGGYTGNISLRYIFRKDESPKMPGF